MSRSVDLIVAGLIEVAGGEIVGRIRFQKLVYLLTKSGLEVDIPFRYHHYGPYSRLLDEALEQAKVFYDLEERIKYRLSDGLPYSVFISHGKSRYLVEAFQDPSLVERIRFIKSHSSTVLELAATIYWLRHEERLSDWRDELLRRKGAKTGLGRREKALDLLMSINLEIGYV